MKKTLSILLAITLLLSCVTVTAHAKEKNGKITSALAEKLDKLPEGEKIATGIWLYYQHDAELIERMTFEECGLTAGTCMTLNEVDIYSKTYNRIAGEMEAAGNKALIEKTGVSDEDILFCGTVSPIIVLKLTGEQVYAISAFREVQILDYDESYIPAEPAEGSEPTVSGHYYENSFKQKYETQYEHVATYRELYYHHGENGEIDWALASCRLDYCQPAVYTTVIGNRVISHGNYYAPFDSGYAVYDVEKDAFIDAASLAAKAYDGFTKAFDESVSEGKPLGDLDSDNEITIIDATIIQRCEAFLRDYPVDDEINLFSWRSAQKYYSDFNRDGERDILDVTAIQRYLVELPY